MPPAWFMIFAIAYAMATLIAVAWRFMPHAPRNEEDGLLDFPELGLHGRVDGACPVQGDGMIDEYAFLFFAQNDAWSFEVIRRLDDPCNAPESDCMFRLEGNAAAASYMDADEAGQIIRGCAEKFHSRDQAIAR